MRYSLICCDLLNCLRTLGTMVITTDSGWNSLNVIFTKQFLTKVAIFHCFDVCSVRPPQIFQVQGKTSTVRSVLPDYLSVSYDYGLAYKFWYQLLTMTLSISSLLLVYLKKIENYQQTHYVITKYNGKIENRDNINTWISWFYSLNSWSDKV